MTPITVTTYSRFLLRGAVIAADISSRFLDSVRALFPQVSCRPANETVDVRALANSLPHEGSGLSVELMGPVGRPFPSRYLPPL
jgi:hypothetical protein